MDLLGSIFLTKEISNDYNKGTPLIAPIVVAMLFYKKLESYVLSNYSNYLLEMIIAFILITILIHRFSFMLYQSHITRWGVYWILSLINIILCVILSIVFFNYIGGTPFSYLINKFNPDIIMKFILKILDYTTRIIFFCKLSKYILKIMK